MAWKGHLGVHDVFLRHWDNAAPIVALGEVETPLTGPNVVLDLPSAYKLAPVKN